jgi:hypothetical protein
VQDSDSSTENKVTLYDVLENVEEASMEQLEVALYAASKVRSHFVGQTLAPAADVWTKIIAKLESEILERTLLKECTTSSTTP